MIFRGKYWFLSNMYPCVIEYNGYIFNCAESAFQAQKCPDRVKEFEVINGFEAKRLGRTVDLVSGWDDKKDQIMSEIIHAKFYQNADLAQKLLETMPEYLVEDNTWGDRYWGRCYGKGLNKLGQILDEVRDELFERATKRPPGTAPLRVLS